MQKYVILLLVTHLLPDVWATVVKTTTPVVIATTIDPSSCESDGIIYNDGETIYEDPDKCYGSYCEDGYVLHWDAACFFSTPSCAGITVDVPGQCCPDCIPTTTPISTTRAPGCYVNDTYFEYGSFVPNDDVCKTCTCTADKGVICITTTCKEPQCVNPRKKKNQCCPICPNGPNCWYGQKKISVGQVWKPNSRMECSCPDPWEPIACCRKLPSVKTLKKLKRKTNYLHSKLVDFLRKMLTY